GIVEAGAYALAAQPPLDRQQKLDAAGAGAHERQPTAILAREHALEQRLEPADESVDRLDRNGMLAGAGYVGGVGGRADIEREKVIGHRRAVPADHAPLDKVHARGPP